MKIAFYTLGCKVNQYDTQTMVALFHQAGYETVSFDENADIYLINTCTVTAMSDKKSRQMISRVRHKNPQASLIVSGCYAQRDAKKLLEIPNVRLVIGNQNRKQIVSLIEKAIHEDIAIDAVDNIKETHQFEELPARCEDRTRAHLKIQDGCNRYCSYCIIPYARGPVRSRSITSIQIEVGNLVSQGFCEFVLTGIHLSSYGLDIGNHLWDAIVAVSEIDGVKRIRLGSLEPMILQEDFVRKCANDAKICRQFHVSMQSGSKSVLKRMNRRYSPQEYASYIQTIRKYIPDAAITTDVIAGFPGETDQEHQETMGFVRKISFARLHVFPFSAREGTVAAKMENQIEKVTKEKRAAELIALGLQTEQAFIESQIGKITTVLIEENVDRKASGYTDHYIRAIFDQEYPANTLIRAKMIETVSDGVRCIQV